MKKFCEKAEVKRKMTDIENLKKTKALFARKVGKSGKNVWNEIRRYHNF